jgi:hypothetical protein
LYTLCGSVAPKSESGATTHSGAKFIIFHDQREAESYCGVKISALSLWKFPFTHLIMHTIHDDARRSEKLIWLSVRKRAHTHPQSTHGIVYMVCFVMLDALCADETLAAGRYFLRRHACVKILLLCCCCWTTLNKEQILPGKKCDIAHLRFLQAPRMMGILNMHYTASAHMAAELVEQRQA